jgi:phosphate transport system substrate-binding protein
LLKFTAAALLFVLPFFVRAQATTNLKGAGATFPFPIYAKWFTDYHRHNPDVEITYEAVGSQAGVDKLLGGSIDFGASDDPAIIGDTAPDGKQKFVFLPTVIGAVVPIVNLPGFPSDISFTPDVLAGIYLGKIKKWNDPLLKSANRGVALPDLDIVVVHRADGSGTSYAWTDFLAKTNAEWKAGVGSGMSPVWPVGRGANGNDGVAKLVKELGGSIGYVEFIYALENHLSFGKVRNQQGRFIAADLESIEAAGATAAGDLKGSLVNASAKDAYPISSFTWFVVPAHIEDDAKRNAITDFLKWMLGPGQRKVAGLGYAALPANVVSAEAAALAKIN